MNQLKGCAPFREVGFHVNAGGAEALVRVSDIVGKKMAVFPCRTVEGSITQSNDEGVKMMDANVY